MLNKAVCTEERVQVKKKKQWGRERSTSPVFIRISSQLLLFRKSENVLFTCSKWGQTDASEITLDKPLPFFLCLIKTQHPFTGKHPAVHTPASLSRNHYKLEKSTFVIVINSSMNRALNEQVDTDGCNLVFYNPAEKPDLCFWLLLQMHPVALKKSHI